MDHTTPLPSGISWVFDPPPLWNSQFHPWWGYGYFLEPHIVMTLTNLCLIYQPGKARRKGLLTLTYTITPESLLLCHNGKVKFSLHTGKKILSNPDTFHTKGSNSVDVGVNTISPFQSFSRFTSLHEQLHHAV